VEATAPDLDVAVFLPGRWCIVRRIADRRSGLISRLKGVATFIPARGGLRYEERGELTHGAYRCEATQAYWFATHRSGAEVYFDDGRFFHTVAFASGRADVAHECDPDSYRGRYRIGGRNGWTLAWQIEGPRKLMFIGTQYVRMAV
jgi:Family of unknown function (DUF6314)